MTYRFCILIALLVTSSANALPDENAKLNNPIIGTWTWMRDVNSCTETYTYRADGTMHVISGKEVSESTYQISSARTPKGFYKLTDKVVKDLGGKDCADDTGDSTGQEATNFVIFSKKGDMYLICENESSESCFGPLKKINNLSKQ